MKVETPLATPLPRCAACDGERLVLVPVAAEDGLEPEMITCPKCIGKGHCRDCEDDSGCDAHGWGEPLDGDEEKSALLSHVDFMYTHEADVWVRGHGVRTTAGLIMRVVTLRWVSEQWLKTVKFSAKPTRHEKKEARRWVLVPHRCAGRPCIESRCECACSGCVEGRRSEWARLGY